MHRLMIVVALCVTAFAAIPTVGHSFGVTPALRSQPSIVLVKSWTQYCNAICRDKCDRTAAAGGLTKSQCYEKWGKINYERGTY